MKSLRFWHSLCFSLIIRGWARLLLLFLFFPSLHLVAQINTERVMLMGRNALYYEDYVLAIQRFNMVINAKPWLGEPYFYRGLAKFYLEDYSGSEIDCSSALERNPYMANHYVLRALCSSIHHLILSGMFPRTGY